MWRPMFTFSLDEEVTIKQARMEATITSCCVEQGGEHWYSVRFWHEGTRTIAYLHVNELEAK